ncbi:MAG: helix-turn-helix domain-containing protein [Pelagimonas sp.]|uniref:TetR/AcrR family transcriptional regulator n=1 Tax=Pelagimonas sp. TaxID=2073170 RepID=UPI003D6C3554
MPKIIDHDAYRLQLAGQAAALFAQNGYSGLGMRKIADALNISKSALYHYFPTKKDLFLAATAVATTPQEATPRTGSPTDQMMDLATGMRDGFAAEMALVFDYIRAMSPTQVAQDPAMVQAIENYRSEITAITGADKSDEALTLVLGALMLDLFAGGHWPADALRERFDRLLA